MLLKECRSWIMMDPKWLSCRKVNEGRWGNEKLVKYFPERYKKGEPIKQWTTKLGEEIVRSILEEKFPS